MIKYCLSVMSYMSNVQINLLTSCVLQFENLEHEKYSKKFSLPIRMRRREDIQVNVAGLRRNIKNLAHNYSDAQVKVREATSNDHWGPSSTLMSEIADLTYNVVAFTEIMQMIWKRLNDHGKNWRHVYKALLLLEYLIKTGSEKVAQQCRENIYAIQTLRDFQYFEDGKDPGLNVREKAKQLGLLLKDEERLRVERARALKAKERFAQAASAFGSDIAADRVFNPVSPQDTGSGNRETWNTCSSTETTAKPEIEFARPQTVGEEELQLQLALAMSREEAEQEEQKRRSDDVRLQLALSQSEKEFKHVTPPTSHLADLLDIDPNICFGNQPPLIDPWGMPISAPTTMAPSVPRTSNDPWSVSSSPSLPSAPTPSSQSATPTNADPWAPVVSSGLPTNHAKTNNDPWRVSSPKLDDGVAPSISPPVSNTGTKNNDPWAPHSSAPVQSPNVLEEDEFTAISNRNLTHRNGTNANQDVFDLTALDNGLSQSESKDSSLMVQNSTNVSRKTPQSFLGENSSLVNLDKLITTPSVPPLPITAQKTGTANPFGGLTSQVSNSVSNSNLYPKSFTSTTSTFQADPFQPVQSRTTLPQPLMPQPNPFLS